MPYKAKEVRKTSRYKGDRLGRIDEDGIAQWYPKCKVRKEGNVYIATPHTTNTKKRTVRKEKSIAVTVNDGKYTLEQSKDKQPDRIVEPTDKSLTKPNNDVCITTHKQIFDELYDKHYKLKPHIRKQTILESMLLLFSSKERAECFVNEQWKRKRRNAYTRKKRFEFKAYNQAYEYFFTITFDDKKHNEQSFEKSLKLAFSNLHKRYGCLFQGVWERGTENDRLHFHGLIYDPNGKITNELMQVSDYNPLTGKKKTYLQSKYFFDKFGRNEFSKIIPQMYDSAIRYITKYLNKQDVKPYYSKGLYSFIESDIDGNDVICRMDRTDERDIRLIVANDFRVWQEGVLIGDASPETMAKAPKVP